MRLSKIKLAGFKSFVDPTQVRVPSNLVGVVGPNGCGKSNIIDAVRWVLGESSAKHLRGGSMADVIFNGSSSRKPVGQASIELTFDNSEGRAGGEYAKFSEIAIKRAVSRDGLSSYFLNGAKCRRRDITDLFLGTGLGPRSYAIIEQGMISRVIDAKPEELRSYLEEAAGISKYKERRRETENRIRHTHENMERLNDLREEVDKQLSHLARQAKTAERYKELKQRERELEAGVVALRIRDLDQAAEQRRSAVSERQINLEAAIADQRAVELEIEQNREAHIEATDALNEVQGVYYQVGSEISRIEQSIGHARDLRQRQESDLEQARSALQELEEHLALDRAELEELDTFLGDHEPAMDEAREQEQAAIAVQHEAEEAMQSWQERWDDFNQRAAEPARAAEVELSRIDQFDRQMRQHQQRLDRLRHEAGTLEPGDLEEEVETMAAEAAELEESQETLREELDAVQEGINSQRDESMDLAREQDDLRQQVHETSSRLASLEAVQQAAMGADDDNVASWLEAEGLADRPRLAQEMRVDEGWERAVEVVLGPHVEALCVDDLGSGAARVADFPGGTLELIQPSEAGPGAGEAAADTLAAHVQAAPAVLGLLEGVRCSDDLGAALAQRSGLGGGESIVTRDGYWLGAGWLRVSKPREGEGGVLAREQEIQTLRASHEEQSATLDEVHERLQGQRDTIREREMRRDELSADMEDYHRQIGDIRARLGARQARLEQIRARRQRLDDEVAEVQEQIETDRAEMEEAHGRRAEAVEAMEELARERETLAVESDRYRNRMDEARAAVKQARDRVHMLNVDVQSRMAARRSLAQSLERMQGQQGQLKVRAETLEQNLAEAGEPVEELQLQLEEQLERRVEAESNLSSARGTVGILENRMRELDQSRLRAEQAVQTLREGLEEFRMALKELQVRRSDHAERLESMGFHLPTLISNMEDDDSVQGWEQELADVTRKIDRLGPINLAAIDEYKEQQQRKEYLDNQHADLTEAMETLESAIRKIDRETRTRFKETFDKVNSKLQEMFPRLFGGGHAYLELTGEDLLETGVSIMARPPGKRISSIQLMSGGEKALTAVALVFAFFELNPAPFCMLDEVDAPLDDANVGRFCDLVREMSERVQFVFISHNKVAMEMAHELLGVTMHEPGVSRLVAVDVDEAARLAAM